MIFESFEQMQTNENIINQLHQVFFKFSSKDVRHRGEYKKINYHVEAFGRDGNSFGVIF